MTMLHIGTEQLYFSQTGLLQGLFEVNVLSHLDFLIKQRSLALPREAAAGVLQALHDTCRTLHAKASHAVSVHLLAELCTHM